LDSDRELFLIWLAVELLFDNFSNAAGFTFD
jgi:hypothetical protein